MPGRVPVPGGTRGRAGQQHVPLSPQCVPLSPQGPGPWQTPQRAAVFLLGLFF